MLHHEVKRVHITITLLKSSQHFREPIVRLGHGLVSCKVILNLSQCIRSAIGDGNGFDPQPDLKEIALRISGMKYLRRSVDLPAGCDL